jgi:hypothetical protein
MTLRTWMLAAALLALAGGPPARADEKATPEPGPWKLGTNVGLNLSQSAFSANWAGGDRGSWVWVLTSQSDAERQFSRSFNWANKVNLAYGQTAKQSPGTDATELRWESPDKTTDLIALQSVARWTLGALIDPYVAFNAETQFQDQSDPRGTLTLNPVKLKESAGLARLLFKTADSEGLTRLGFGFRQTLARAFIDASGGATRSFTSNDGGIEWQTDVKQPLLAERVLYKGTLLVFQPVFYSKSGDLETVDDLLRDAYPGRESVGGFWRMTDVNFTNDFSAQITKNLGVNLAVQWVYDKFDVAALVDPALARSADPAVLAAYAAQVDKNVRKGGQFREVLALALTYRLF